MPKIPPTGTLAELLDGVELKSRRRLNKADRNRQTLRDQLWPGSAKWIWDINDSEGVVGFATISRLMPLILHLVKILSNGDKTGDPGPVLLELWCRDYGQGLISIKHEGECAYAAGYSSNRAVRTWRGHMLKLVELGFIKAKADGISEYGQVLLVNPLAVCARLRQEGKVPEEWWTSFTRRASEISATIPPPIDFTSPPPESEPKQESKGSV